MKKTALAARVDRLLALTTLVVATVAAPVSALVIVSDRDSESVTAPTDDPGWANVGTIGGLTGIYLGSGWTLTASHVGTGPVVLGGHTFSAAPDTTVQLRNRDGSLADLIVFRIQGAPHLPRLRIARATPQVGTPVVLIGNGRNRGAPVSWSGHEGFAWGTASALRWGTNTVFKSGGRVNSTEAFVTQFRKDGATPHEAQAAVGDSGGAVFVKVQGEWWLAGVLFMVAAADKQPPETALYGNFTVSADLARYRPQIEKLMAEPMKRSPVKSKENRPR
ncbi:MAG TPA: hypothetical protein DEP35_09105 [Deltaproteobacteria bacterium]|jgi:hypothetical protein|nr:hypothetical protein [Deltaproteobacteria bacterium]